MNFLPQYDQGPDYSVTQLTHLQSNMSFGPKLSFTKRQLKATEVIRLTSNQRQESKHDHCSLKLNIPKETSCYCVCKRLSHRRALGFCSSEDSEALDSEAAVGSTCKINVENYTIETQSTERI